MSFPTEDQHFDAVMAALTAAGARPHDYDSSPTQTAYSLVSVADRFGGVQRLSGQTGTRSVRVVVRAVGSTMDNVRLIRQKVDAALREQRLTVAGHISTPVAFETATSPGPDGDVLASGQWYSASSAYTYTV